MVSNVSKHRRNQNRMKRTRKIKGGILGIPDFGIRKGIRERFKKKESEPLEPTEPIEDTPEFVKRNDRKSNNCIIVTHNTRMRCLCASLGVIDDDKPRFQNCAILHFKLISDTDTEVKITVNLIYSGEVDEEEGKEHVYYTTSNNDITNNNSISGGGLFGLFGSKKVTQDNLPQIKYKQFIPYNKSLDETSLIQKFNLLPSDIRNASGRTINIFYIPLKEMSSSGMNLLSGYDSKLTEKIDRDQAIKSGKELAKYLSKKSIKINVIFLSDLVRAGETAGALIEGAYKQIIEQNNEDVFEVKTENIKFVVLPCTHEIKQVEGIYPNNKECDITGIEVASENMMTCYKNRSLNILPSSLCSSVTVNITTHDTIIKKDWTFYDIFYECGRRGRTKKLWSAFSTYECEKCRETNMLSMAVFYMNKNINKTNLKSFITKRKTDNELKEEYRQKYNSDHDAADKYANIKVKENNLIRKQGIDKLIEDANPWPENSVTQNDNGSHIDPISASWKKESEEYGADAMKAIAPEILPENIVTIGKTNVQQNINNGSIIEPKTDTLSNKGSEKLNAEALQKKIISKIQKYNSLSPQNRNKLLIILKQYIHDKNVYNEPDFLINTVTSKNYNDKLIVFTYAKELAIIEINIEKKRRIHYPNQTPYKIKKYGGVTHKKRK